MTHRTTSIRSRGPLTPRSSLSQITAVSAAAACAAAALALPEDAMAQDPSTGSEAAETGQSPINVIVPPQQSTTVYTPGYPAPGTDPNAHLPSSARGTTDASKSGDGFDLLNQGSANPSIRGNEKGSYVTDSRYVPEAHTVRRGDTLWDISGQYYKNPYNWPRVWAYNPQIQNPHWIYPGDRVRLREAGAYQGSGVLLPGRTRTVPPETVFLRDVGWIDDRKEDAWGEIVGSNDDQMLLSEGDDIYVQIGENHEIAIGQQLTIFRPLREVESEDNDDAKGELVSIRGTARIDRFNPKTRMVRAKIVESVDVIERGERIGPVGRRFDVVAPSRNEQDVEAKIIAALYPSQFYGQHQIVFLDKGEKEGVRPGNRFFAVRHGDRYRATLDGAGALAKFRPKMEDDRAAQVEPNDTSKPDEELFPDETYAEVRVLRVKDHTSTALVTASTHELERTARLIARKGY
jgi:LysM domain